MLVVWVDRLGDHPRSRGEYQGLGHHLFSESGSSPLSRGIQRIQVQWDADGGIIPALAGNTSFLRLRLGSLRDHPRSRGEYSACGAGNVHLDGSSPLSRGIQPKGRKGRRGLGIIPALAGNT